MEYIDSETDECVKKMFKRFAKSDGTITALFPFQMLSHSFLIDLSFDAEREKNSNANLRRILHSLVEKVRSHVDPSNPEAINKANHYISALEEQIKVCAETDNIIEKLNRPFPR